MFLSQVKCPVFYKNFIFGSKEISMVKGFVLWVYITHKDWNYRKQSEIKI